MSKKISQLEARRLKKRVLELEQREQGRFSRWGSDYPSGIVVCTLKLDPNGRVCTAIKTSRMLRHAVVATVEEDGMVYFYALPSPKEV